MRKQSFWLSLFVLLAIASLGLSQAVKDKKKAGDSMTMSHQSHEMNHQSHVMVTPDEVKWGQAPPSLPSGAQFAVVDGDPTKAGADYTIRAKMPAGYKISPHWHPVDEHVTVIEGTLAIGLGEKFDESAGHDLKAGSYARMPKGVRHFAWAKTDTVIQVHGTGPFEINYVNPGDDPRKQGNSKK